ncbi:MAG: M15 family metallopeptidase [Bacilli bacterium]|nr:M15 family metallopeptidase [Bacilli bacterium]
MKKRKLKIKRRNIIILVLILLLVVFYKPVSSVISIKGKGYSLSSSRKIYKYGIKDIVLNKDYSIILDDIITTDLYNEAYLDDYFKIDYYEKENFLSTITNLLNVGYKNDSINVILKKDDNVIKVLENRYIDDINNYLSYDYFRIDNLDRYLNYFNGDYKDTIIRVNIGLDKEYYTDPVVISEYSKEMVVNKYNKLDENVKLDLVLLTKCAENGEYLVREAKEAYDLLCDASKKDGLSLSTTSSYRSYKEQESTYNYYLKNNGEEYAKNYVARAGFSEHQTGLAVDVKSLNASPFKSSREYKWMIDNSYKYGFILRYPQGMEEFTGYSPESWHFRYVGIDIAKYIHDNNITYEEYCATH